MSWCFDSILFLLPDRGSAKARSGLLMANTTVCSFLGLGLIMKFGPRVSRGSVSRVIFRALSLSFCLCSFVVCREIVRSSSTIVWSAEVSDVPRPARKDTLQSCSHRCVVSSVNSGLL